MITRKVMYLFYSEEIESWIQKNMFILNDSSSSFTQMPRGKQARQMSSLLDVTMCETVQIQKSPGLWNPQGGLRYHYQAVILFRKLRVI